MPMERDEDELSDEAYEKKLASGDKSDWTQDDHDFTKLTDKVFKHELTLSSVSEGDEGDEGDEGEEADEEEISDEEQQALDQYIPPDITTNNPIPYNER